MTEDPKKLLVEMVGRLSRETQLHLDERHRHFEVTDMVLKGVSLLLVVLAIFNVYYIYVLSADLDGIVTNIDSIHKNMNVVDVHMLSLTSKVELMDQHMGYMEQISADVGGMTGNMSLARGSMRGITGEMNIIEQDMQMVSGSMLNIEQRLGHMTGGVSVMRENVHQMSGPAGAMNSILP